MELRNSFLTTNNMLSSTTTTTNTAAVAGASSALRASNLVSLPPNVHALGAQFREIHKNTWLKRLTAEGKKITVGPKKSERSWVVFCVHDDTEALLEGYAEPRQAPAHSPEWIVSLRNTLHVSHALIPNSHEFEFVVALNNEVVRFHATSWEIMQEWVETLRAKLREMKILSPRENLYTKLPEVRMPLLPTRDPTSPLPAPPPVPAALVPGVERVVTHNNVAEITETITTTTTTGASTSNGIISTSAITTTTTTTMTAMSNTLTQNLLNMLTDPITAYSENLNATLDDSIVDEEEEEDDDNDDDDDDDDDIENIEVELRQPPNDELSLMSSSSKGQQRNSTRVSIKAPTADLNCDNLLPRISTTRTSVDEAHITELQITGNQPKTATTNTESSTNITIIEVSAASTDNQEVRKTNAEIFQFPEIKKSSSETNDYKCNVQIIPSNSINGNNNNNSTVQILPTSTTTTVHVANAGSSTVPVYGTCFAGAPLPKSPFLQKRIIVSASSSSGVTNITVNDKISNKQNDKKTTAYYDKVFLSTSHPKTVATQTTDTQPPLQPQPQPSSSRVLIADSGRKTETNITERQPTKGNNYGITVVGNKSKTQLNNEPTASSRATATSPITVSTNEEAPMGMPRLMRGATEAVITRASRRDAQLEIPQRSSRVSLQSRNRSNKNAANNNDELVTTNKPTTTAELELRKSIMQQRRRSASTSDAHTQRNARNSNNNELTNAHGFRMQPPPHVTNEALINSPKRLTLREQQVMQLRREIMHPGGVRLQLRRKDCVGSIAWVDCLNTVWIAGWKQKEHPVLYNALHIGDQLLSIAGMPVSTAAEANKIIRNTNTLFVEVLVRRIPFGRGYAIRREREGQCLGLIRDGNTATIVDVVPNSLAARHGLPPKAPSCDGNALTFWNLTEINGRPLNLFFKENEIRDRLNSVGRDISILVQPADLISKLKKQLKSLRGYKDYLVQ